MYSWCKQFEDRAREIKDMQHQGVEPSMQEAYDLAALWQACQCLRMIDYWDSYHADYKSAEAHLSAADAANWVEGMKNQDGTTGGHWTVEQTTEVSKRYGIDIAGVGKSGWNVLMNMAYSDGYHMAKELGMSDDLQFYVLMAEKHMHDPDGLSGGQWLAAYYRDIIKPAHMMHAQAANKI